MAGAFLAYPVRVGGRMIDTPVRDRLGLRRRLGFVIRLNGAEFQNIPIIDSGFDHPHPVDARPVGGSKVLDGELAVRKGQFAMATGDRGIMDGKIVGIRSPDANRSRLEL